MLKRFRGAPDTQSGLTVLELLIAVVINGVVASTALVALTRISHRGHTVVCKSDITNVTMAADAYYADTTPSAFPADDADADAKLTPRYLRTYPTDVTYTRTGDTFTVVGKAGTACAGVTA